MFLFMVCQGILAKTWTVCPTCEHSSIKQTIQEANAHDTLLIQKGTYREFEILVDKLMNWKLYCNILPQIRKNETKMHRVKEDK